MFAAHVTNSPLEHVMDWTLKTIGAVSRRADLIMPLLNPFAEGRKSKVPPGALTGKDAIMALRALGLKEKPRGEGR